MRQICWVVFMCTAACAAFTSHALATSAHSQFIRYPGFLKPGAAIGVIHDKGLVTELIVDCGDGRSGILTASKIERVVCGPDHRCTNDLARAVRRLCR